MEVLKAAPEQMLEMDRTAGVRLDEVYIEDNERKLNLLIKNKIEVIHSAIIDLLNLSKAIEPSATFSALGGEPGEVGFAVKGVLIELFGQNNSKIRSDLQLKLGEARYPTYARISGICERGIVTMVTDVRFNLVDKGDGTVLVLISSKETGTSFFENGDNIIQLALTCCLCLPLIYCIYDGKVSSLSTRVRRDLKDYLNAARLENVTFYASKLAPVAMVAPVAASSTAAIDIATQIEKLKDLHEKGVLSDEEFKMAKMKVIQG